MTDLLETGSQWLSDQAIRHTSRKVTLVSADGNERLSVSATKSEQKVDVSQADGTSIEVTRVDWIVAKTRLAFDGRRQSPPEGMTIEEIDTGTGRLRIYEAQPLGTEAHFRDSGADWRIFTRLVKEV